MFFKEFRKIVQDYYREYDISPFPSQKKYKLLKYGYEDFLCEGCTLEDNDVTVAQFLDTREDLMTMIPTFNAWELTPTPIAFADCQPCCETPKRVGKPIPWTSKKQEVENTMTTVNTERQYLNNRINDVKYIKRDDLAKTFNIYGSDQPVNYKELIDAITNKTYTLDTKKTDRVDEDIANGCTGGCWGPFYGIKFNKPNSPDFEGYNAAEKVLNKAYQDVKDIVNTSDAAAGLKALQDFELWTYTAPVPPTASA